MSNGYFTIAQGDAYVRMAYALQLSLLVSQTTVKRLSIGVTANQHVPPKYKLAFDQVVEIPWKDHAEHSVWKLENEWKSIYMSPYDNTIKLDADMLFQTDISSWWPILCESECVFTTKIKNYRNAPIASDPFHRQTFIDNDLPNVYTAMFFFKKTDITFQLFKLAEDIFNNWMLYYETFLIAKSRPNYVSTDVVFALAAKILNIQEYNKYPDLDIPTFTHMKTKLQGWGECAVHEDWTRHVSAFYTPECVCKIGNYLQINPLHYHIKHFITDEMISYLERQVGI